MDATYGAYVAAEKNTCKNTDSNSNIKAIDSNNKANYSNNTHNHISNNVNDNNHDNYNIDNSDFWYPEPV